MKEVNKKHIIEFDGQREGEKTLFVFRRSLVTIRKGVFLFLVAIGIALMPHLIWQSGNSVLFLISVIIGVIGLVILLYYIFIWYFTFFIVTNQRIRYINQKSFFGSEVVDLSLSKIENISYNIRGFTGSILGLGNIIIQTLAGDLVVNKVKHPAKVYNRLQDLMDCTSNKKGYYEEVDK